MNCIKVRNLRKSFDEKIIFNNINITISIGKVTILTGPSGIGKTTFLNILMGLLSFDAGEIVGLPLRQSAVFQEDRLIPDISTARNIALGCPKPPSRSVILDHLRRVGLEGSANCPARELSGGMARRAAVVRACMAPSQIIFMDEPFAGLDAATAQQVIEYVRDTRGDRTLLAAVHDQAHAKALGGIVINLSELL